MARKVDHDQRRGEIVDKAIRLFSQVGFDNVSLQMIAAAAGVSRTVLYRYFCSKREVLDAAIVTLTGLVDVRCGHILRSTASDMEKLERICHTIVDVMFKNKEFLVAVFDFVVGMVRSGADMNSQIRRFTSGTHKALRLLVTHAVKKGEVRSVRDVDRIADSIYSQFESCAMRIVLGTEGDAKAAKRRFTDMVIAISLARQS